MDYSGTPRYKVTDDKHMSIAPLQLQRMLYHIAYDEWLHERRVVLDFNYVQWIGVILSQSNNYCRREDINWIIRHYTDVNFSYFQFE